jgi:hypothetical protein
VQQTINANGLASAGVIQEIKKFIKFVEFVANSAKIEPIGKVGELIERDVPSVREDDLCGATTPQLGGLIYLI